MKSNMQIAHTKEVRLFYKVTGVYQDLIQHIIASVEEDYLADIRNCTMDSINDTVTNILTHLQDNCSQLMPHRPLERKDIVKEKTYHPRELSTTVLSAVEELPNFSDITGTLYT